MLLTYKSYLLSINSQDTMDLDLESNFNSESSDWNQYFDIELQILISPKNRNHIIRQPYVEFRQLPANKFFKRKNQIQNQNQNQNNPKLKKVVDIDILDPIKEELEHFEDIETGKIHKNPNPTADTNEDTKTDTDENIKVYLYLINLQNIVVTSLIYISHIALIVFLIKI